MKNKWIIILLFISVLLYQCGDSQGSGYDLNAADIQSLIKQKPGTLIYFWTTWCGPCRKTLAQTLPVIEKTLDKSKAQLLVIAVSHDDNAVNKIRKTTTLQGPAYRLKFMGPDIWLTHKAAIENTLQELFPDQEVWNNSVPVFVLTDKNRQVLYKKLPSDLDELLPVLQDKMLLAASAAAAN